MCVCVCVCVCVCKSADWSGGQPKSSLNRLIVEWIECSLMVRETWIQSLVVSYQRL